MKLKTIRDSFHAEVLNYRKVLYVLESDDFAIAYSNATSREQREVQQVIDRADKRALVKFVKAQLLKLTPFHQMSVKQLREIGRNVRVPDYWKKDKITLIEEIENVVSRLKKSG